MYAKKILLGLEVTNLPVKKDEAIYRAKTVDYLVKSRSAMHGRLLIVAFYERAAVENGFSLPTLVLYQTKKGYSTKLIKDGKEIWKKSKISHPLGSDCYRRKQAVCMTKADEKRIRTFIPDKTRSYTDKNDILQYIDYYQAYLLDQKNAARKKTATKETDRRMKTVPALPEAFDRWMYREPLNDHYIIYKRTSKKKAEGCCTKCGASITFRDAMPYHKNTGVCPHCKSNITYNSLGMTRAYDKKTYVSIVQPCRSGEYVLRFFNIVRSLVDAKRENGCS